MNYFRKGNSLLVLYLFNIFKEKIIEPEINTVLHEINLGNGGERQFLQTIVEGMG